MKKILAVLIAVLSIAIIAVVVFGVYLLQNQQGQQQPTPRPEISQKSHRHLTPTADLTPTVFGSPVATGMPYVQGSQIIDGSGHPLLLHGAQIESPFNYIQGWQSGKQPSA